VVPTCDKVTTFQQWTALVSAFDDLVFASVALDDQLQKGPCKPMLAQDVLVSQIASLFILSLAWMVNSASLGTELEAATLRCFRTFVFFVLDMNSDKLQAVLLHAVRGIHVDWLAYPSH
jgi:hypothetical protein